MSQIIEMGRTSNEGGLVPDLLLASSSLSPTALQGVRGSVVAAKSGLPLAGVEINWITSDQSQHHRGSTDVVIGAAKIAKPTDTFQSCHQ